MAAIDKLQVKTYVHAKHNLATDDIKAQIVFLNDRIKKGEGDLAVLKSNLAGYEKALAERK